MKRYFVCFFTLGVLFFCIMAGCASTGPTRGYATSLEEAHPDRFEKTVMGMDVNEFKAIWPEAIRSGASSNNETYEFVYEHLVGGLYGNAHDYKIYTYFYFTNNKLVKYESTKKTL